MEKVAELTPMQMAVEDALAQAIAMLPADFAGNISAECTLLVEEVYNCKIILEYFLPAFNL